MKKYNGINYESNEDCFAKTAHVCSEFIYGDPSVIDKPLFTVFIPTYKRVDMLKTALESVINQRHVYFQWEILVIDNDPYDGRANSTEKLIRELNNPRIMYYRNRENLRPGDNFNRGIYLARGKWVMMLHDDDVLIYNSLQNMGRVVKFLEKHCRKPLGAINTVNHTIVYNPDEPEKFEIEVKSAQAYYTSLPTNLNLYRLTQLNVLFTGHIGGSIPSNGATYNRAALLDVGGFNDDFGISADLILNYCLENKYDVYSTTVPYGLYRWGVNTMSKPESTYNTIKAGFDFREYAYSKNIFSRIWGAMFRSAQYRRFSLFVVNQYRNNVDSEVLLSDYDSVYSKKPNGHWYVFYAIFINQFYGFIKSRQMKRLYNKSINDAEIWQ